MNSLKSSLKVRLILFNQGKILLLKQTKLNGGNYPLVGGNVEFEISIGIGRQDGIGKEETLKM